MLITNYITSAWRNILRHKLFSIINIMGLAIGLAAVMLIALYVRYETSYDSFWKNADNIYRLHATYSPPEQIPTQYAAAPPAVVSAMKEAFPEIDNFARIAIFNTPIINNGIIYQNSLRAVDPEFIDIFDLKILDGDISAAVKDTNGIALSKSNASRIFGTQNPMGEIFTIERHGRARDYEVRAIFDDLPETSRLQISSLIGYTEQDWDLEDYSNFWYRFPFVHSYFTLKKGADISDRLTEFVDRTFPSPPNSNGSKRPSERIEISYQNIKNLHLNFQGDRELNNLTGDKNSVIMYSLVALLILFIASINFMNLSTARATQRAREVGIRKVVGAARRNLISQFIGESVIITLIALAIAFSLAELFLPFFNDFIGKKLIITYLSFDSFLFLIGAVLVGLAGGSYPAFITSSFRPSEVLRSNQSNETDRSLKFRFVLVVTQFAISIFLFVSTAVIYNQFRLIENYDYGYNPQKMLFTWGGDFELISQNFDALSKRLTDTPEIVSVTTSSNVPVGGIDPGKDAIRTDEISKQNPVMVNFMGVGYNFFETFEIPILKGRSFSSDYKDQRANNEEIAAGTDHTGGLILNRSALRALNISPNDDPIGKLIYMRVGNGTDKDNVLEAPFRIVGTVPDVQHQNLKTPSVPAFYQLVPDKPFYFIIRYTGTESNALQALQAIWKDEFPDSAFNPILAEDIRQFNYGDELKQMTMFAAFSGLAIFIACLGLFGLASFTAERRTKEIGIRKVFGAEVWQIVRMLVFQFSKPVLIANVIAWPVAYLAMSRWLESFVYRIDDMVIIALCLIAGLTALLIAWATVAGNSYAVARQNPIKALRYE